MNTASQSTARGMLAEEAGVGSRTAARLLICCVLCLFVLGLVMLFSTGIGQSNPSYYALRQAQYGGLAFFIALIACKLPFRYWRPLLAWLLPVTIILLVMVRLVGKEINGSYRWLPVGPVNFQPSELAKLTVVVWIAFWMSHMQRRCREFRRGFLYPAAGVGLLCLLILIEPDFGTTVLLGLAGLSLMFLAGTRFVYLACSGLLGTGGIFLLVLDDPERLSRITTFLEPDKYESDEGYQLMHSLYALIEGGARGVGFGQSLQKYSYLPEAHTDFILAIIGEELGIGGTLAVLFCFLLFFLCGMRIAWNCPDPFGRLLAYGITIMITLQACINIGVVTASMPTKGLPLPYVSYGGSSLLFTLLMTGILVGIAHQSDQRDRAGTPARDSRHWV